MTVPPCIRCGNELFPVWPDMDPDVNQPGDGVACRTGGNYGSTLFDPFDGSRIEFNLCDPCLVDIVAKGHAIAHGKDANEFFAWVDAREPAEEVAIDLD